MDNVKLKVIILFGGQSGEHEVSLQSAKSVLQSINPNRYNVETIGISKEGQWYWGVVPENFSEHKEDAPLVTLVHDPTNPRFISLDGTLLPEGGRFDVIFPVLHGPHGEDGTLQGLLEMSNIAYVGSGVLGSALGMDKDRMKAAFREAGLPLAKHLAFLRSEWQNSSADCLDDIEKGLGYPCFVKPANLGSSVGITKAHNRAELSEALHIAASYDRKLVVEEHINGREIEVSVLGNDYPVASLPGEILPAKEFYDYDAKYHDTGSRLIIPAILDDSVISILQENAIKAFRAVEAAGLSRVDFFLTPDNKVIVNEINTMPGFTSISMYPKLWEVSGLVYSDLIDRLLKLALERYQEKGVMINK